MRPIAIDQQALRGVQRDLESARDEISAAIDDVRHPAGDFPQRDLLVEGVRELLDDALTVVRACSRLSNGIDDSVLDFDGLDGFIATAAAVDRVDPR